MRRSMRIFFISFLATIALMLNACATKKVAEDQQRYPASEGDLLCLNRAHTPSDYFHYVLRKNQKINGREKLVASGDIVLLDDYNHFDAHSSHADFPVKILNWNGNSVELQGVTLETARGAGISQDFNPIVEKDRFHLQSVNGSGTVEDAQKARRMDTNRSPISCSLSGPPVLE